MVKQKRNFFIGAILLLASGHLGATDCTKKDSCTWKLAKEEDHISIYYRWLDTDTMKAREMRALFSIDADINSILPQFTSAANYSLWAVGIKECKIYPLNDSNWVNYMVMDYPWPFKKKDLVAKCQLIKNGNGTTLKMLADNDFLDKNPEMERILNYQGVWSFIPGGKGKTLVDYRVVSFTKPVFPRFVQDPVIQDLLIDSFRDLKRLAESK